MFAAVLLWAARSSLQSCTQKLPDHTVCHVTQACTWCQTVHFCVITQSRLMPRQQMPMLSAATINLCGVQKLVVQGAAKDVTAVFEAAETVLV